MAHKIELLDIDYYSRKPAWHGLGVTTVGRDMTEDEAAHAVGADVNRGSWDAEAVHGYIPFFADTGRPWISHNGEQPPPGIVWRKTEASFNVRSDLPVSDPSALLSPRGVGEGYELVQYSELLGLAKVAAGESGAAFESAGTLESGKKAWLLLRMPEPMLIAKNGRPGDRVNKYLLIHSSHDGSSAFVVAPTSIRVVCWNTLSMALDGAKRFNHTANIIDRIGQVRRALADIGGMFDAQESTYQSMARQAVDNRFAAALLTALYPDPKPTKENPRPSTARAERKRNEIFTLFNGRQAGSGDSGMVLESGQRTAYALYNAVTEHQGYCKVRRFAEDATDRDRAEGRFARNVLGTADQREREDAISAIMANIGHATSEVDSLMDQIAV